MNTGNAIKKFDAGGLKTHIINYFGLNSENSGRPSLHYENNFMLGIAQPK